MICGGTVIRTSHMTGVLTDICALGGRRFKRWLSGASADARQLSQELLTCQLLLLLYACYALGGVLGALVYPLAGDACLLGPAAACFVVGACYTSYRLRLLERSVQDAKERPRSPRSP